MDSGIITAMTKELATALGSEGEALFSRELRAGVAKAVDQIVLDELLASAPSSSAAGLPAAIGNVVGALTTSATSKVYLVLASDVARAASAGGEAGMLYPMLGVGGGQIGQLTTLVSDALADGEIAALDADQIAANPGEVAIDASKNASLQMTDMPVAGPQNLVSLWQTNSLVLLALRSFAFSVISGTGVPAAKCQIETP
jgi:hypothetical protein